MKFVRCKYKSDHEHKVSWGVIKKDVIEFIDQGKLKIGAFIETFPMSEINQVFKNTLNHKYTKRSVLVPDFE